MSGSSRSGYMKPVQRRFACHASSCRYFGKLTLNGFSIAVSLKSSHGIGLIPFGSIAGNSPRQRLRDERRGANGRRSCRACLFLVLGAEFSPWASYRPHRAEFADACAGSDCACRTARCSLPSSPRRWGNRRGRWRVRRVARGAGRRRGAIRASCCAIATALRRQLLLLLGGEFARLIIALVVDDSGRRRDRRARPAFPRCRQRTSLRWACSSGEILARREANRFLQRAAACR